MQKFKTMKRLLLVLALGLLFNGNSQQSQQQPSEPLANLEHQYEPSSYIDLTGEEISGSIKFDEISTFYIWFKGENDEKGTKILAKEIKSFKYNNDQTYISLNGNFYTKENSELKIQIYKKFVAKKGVAGATISGGNVLGQYVYYVSIENVLELTSMNDLSFSPFHKKVSKLLSACPELSEKVASKEKGYKKTMVKPAHVIWKTLAKEYETCNK